MQTLVDGKIPANTVCPFRAKCEIAQNDACKHNGVNHTVPFSCAAARGFEIIIRNKDYHVSQNN